MAEERDEEGQAALISLCFFFKRERVLGKETI